MKYVLFLSFIVISTMFAAQDIIHLENGEEIEAKVIRITKSKITYKNYSYLNGPEYEIDRKNVSSILYENGDKEEISESKTLSFQVNKNIISFNYGDFMVNRFSFNYERLLSDGKIGLKIPFGVTYQDPDYNYNNRMLYYTGLDFNLYPVGQKKISYFTGIGIRVGVINQYVYTNYYVDDNIYGNGYYITSNSLEKRLAAGFYVNNGIVIHLTRNMSISGMFGLGVRDIEGPSWGVFNAVGELNVSVRF